MAGHHELSEAIARANLLATQNSKSLAGDAFTRKQIVNDLKALTRAVQTPMEQAWDIFFQPHHLSVLHIALDAGWLPILNDAGDPGLTAHAVAKESGADPVLVRRLLRFLAAAGTVREVEHETFAATEMTRFFTTPAMQAGLRHAGHDYAVPISRMPEYFGNNGYREPPGPEYGIYAHAYGSSMFNLMARNPRIAEAFNTFMAAARAGNKLWLDVYPVSTLRVSADDDVLLVDVGGGRGHELAALAERQAALRLPGRLILQDRQEVIGQIDDNWRSLFTALNHDFFTPQPDMCTGARAFYLRNILHDWPDKECITILSRLCEAMEEGYSTLLINEIVLPDTNISFWSTAFDITMMAAVSGRERTKSEWEQLISSVSGLHVEKIWPLGDGGESIIEVVKDTKSQA